MYKILFDKFIHWQYENEYRIYISITERARNGFCYSEFGTNLVLKEVIIGYKSSVTLNSVKHCLLDPARGEVDIWKVKPSGAAFEMVPDQDAIY